MRLLIGMPDPDSLGGPAACEPPFVAELRKQSIEVELETYVYGDKLFPTPFSRRVKRVLGSAIGLRRKLKSGSFDLLHLNTSFDARALLRDVVTLAVIGRQSTRIFIKFHGSDADLFRTNKPLLKMLVRKLLSRADSIGVLSTEEKKNFVGAGWGDKKLFVVKNIVERTFPARSPTFNSQYRLPEGLPTLLFIARFILAKGLVDVIRACAILRDQGKRCVLLCVGDGPARRAAEAETEKLGLGEYVRFLGLVPEDKTAEFYANSTMLVLPTYHYEGFPMAVFYAVAAGMPIITTRIRGAADHLDEPANCLWVEPRNPAMLAEKVAFLLNNCEVRTAMGEANRRLAQQFRAEVVAREYLEAYKEVIDRV